MGHRMQFAKILSVASTKLTYSVPTEMREILLCGKKFFKSQGNWIVFSVATNLHRCSIVRQGSW